MPEALTHGHGQDLLAAYKEAWERRDPERAVALFSEEAEYREDPFAESLRGRNAIRAYWNAVAAEQQHVEFDAEQIWVSGRTVLASWHAAFSRLATAERVRMRGFMTLEVNEAGLVWRFREWAQQRTVGTDSTLAREPASQRG
jgi:nuclear transport factor 2 (NTF2) superfamily protein